jgi:hypothetical protein
MGQADVRWVPSGLRFNMVCTYSKEVLLRNLPTERAAYVNAGTVASRKTVCGARETRREHLPPCRLVAPLCGSASFRALAAPDGRSPAL